MFKIWQRKNQLIFCSLDADDDDKNSSQHIVGIIISIKIVFFSHMFMNLIEGFIFEELMLTKPDNDSVNTQWPVSSLGYLKRKSLAIFSKYYSPLEMKLHFITIMFTGIKTKWSDCWVISNVTGRAQRPCVCVSIPNNSQFNEFKSLSICETGRADDNVPTS